MRITQLILAASLATLATPSQGGAFVFADQGCCSPATVTHPTTYNGTGGNIVVTICIDPATPFAAQAVSPVKNVAATWSNLQATSGNLRSGGNNNVPTGQFDVESTILHEAGHCIGLAHPNAASESGLPGVQAESTKAKVGTDAVLNINSGVDGLHGSRDDVRGDDINLHWFETGSNNPFLLPSLIQRSNFSAALTGLPGGNSFVVNCDRTLAATPIYGLANTECVMQQGQGGDEAQRTLGADDVVSRRIAMAGRDGIQGNADDYTMTMQYAGLTTSCNIIVRFDSAGFAACQIGGSSLPGSATDFRITTAAMSLGSSVNWFFNDVIYADGFQ